MKFPDNHRLIQSRIEAERRKGTAAVETARIVRSMVRGQQAADKASPAMQQDGTLACRRST